MWHELAHVVHGAHAESERGNHTLAGIAYIGAGFFLAPILIGIPLMIYGFYKLMK
ncbi:hypothetical protein [Fimbriiglobus ruber]|uniref:Uncharacterized protein n=1 Tax=Fimbriiglobus ruber TaxID=1908690 RepID=A0A225DD86_9BACT|nr:hypothetical protein [Fimbriiglobus ruber]OWK38943.1 hypothetical protein FRUB_06319 [Fimbriiglobus ruber]